MVGAVADNEAFSKEFVIKNRLGLHARAAAQFVRLVNKFTSDVTLSTDSFEINGKSILGVLSLAAVKGTKLTIAAKGLDAEQAMEEIETLVESGFGEGIE